MLLLLLLLLPAAPHACCAAPTPLHVPHASIPVHCMFKPSLPPSPKPQASSNRRTFWYTTLEVVALLGLTGVQVMVITHFFKKGGAMRITV